MQNPKPQTIQLLNFDNAVNYFIHKFCEVKNINKVEYVLSNFQYLNKKRYALVIFNFTQKYLVLFKRDFFHKFGDYFAEYGEKGLGETINIDALKFAFSKNIKKIVFIYENGHI